MISFPHLYQKYYDFYQFFNKFKHKSSAENIKKTFYILRKTRKIDD